MAGGRRLVGRERTLTLVCHAEAEGSAGDAPLTARGRAEAEAAGRAVAALGPVRAIWTGDATRSVETADRLRGAWEAPPPLHRTVDLRECLPGRPVRDLPQDAPFEELVYRAGAAQADRAFARFFVPARHHDKHEVLVTHANLIRALVCRALGVDPLAWTHLEVGTASLTRARVHSDGAIRLLCCNERGYLAHGGEVPF